MSNNNNNSGNSTAKANVRKNTDPNPLVTNPIIQALEERIKALDGSIKTLRENIAKSENEATKHRETEEKVAKIAHVVSADLEKAHTALSVQKQKNEELDKIINDSPVGPPPLPPPPSKIVPITINVGGELFTTTTKTLDTPFFNVLLRSNNSSSSPDFPVRDEHGNIYIDRSSVLFTYLLECLRIDGVCPTIKDLDDKTYDSLCLEAEYFGAFKLLVQLRGFVVPASLGVPCRAAQALSNECKATVMKLLYKASRDGFSAKKFHEFCDGIYPSVVIVHTDNGSVFGCYSEVPWKATPDHVHTPGTDAMFLFSLVSPTRNSPVFFYKNPKQTVYVHNSKDLGPALGLKGKDDDFLIADNPNTAPNSSVKGFPESGMFASKGCSNTVFTGFEKFVVLDYEVYFIPKWDKMEIK